MGAYAKAGISGDEASFFIGNTFSQALLLSLSSALLVLWGSTDLLEWGDIVAKSVVAAAQRVRMPSLLVTLTTLAAVGMMVNTLRQLGGEIALILLLLTVPVGIVVLLARFARIRSNWPAQIPPLVLLLGAIYLNQEGSGIILLIIYSVALSHGLAPQIILPLTWLVSLPVKLAVLTVALILVARGRLGKPKQGAIGLFLAMVVLITAIEGLSNTLNAAGFSVPVLPSSLPNLLNGLRFLAVGGDAYLGPPSIGASATTTRGHQASHQYFLAAGRITSD